MAKDSKTLRPSFTLERPVQATETNFLTMLSATSTNMIDAQEAWASLSAARARRGITAIPHQGLTTQTSPAFP